MIDLVERLDAIGAAMGSFGSIEKEAAREINRLREENERLQETLNDGLASMVAANREAGEWRGKYEAAGYPFTLDGWIERAKKAEAENARLRQLVSEAYKFTRHPTSAQAEWRERARGALEGA